MTTHTTEGQCCNKPELTAERRFDLLTECRRYSAVEMPGSLWFWVKRPPPCIHQQAMLAQLNKLHKSINQSINQSVHSQSLYCCHWPTVQMKGCSTQFTLTNGSQSQLEFLQFITTGCRCSQNHLVPKWGHVRARNPPEIPLADYVQPPLSLVLYRKQGHGSVTDHSPSPAHESGTVCPLHCKPWRTTNSSRRN